MKSIVKIILVALYTIVYMPMYASDDSTVTIYANEDAFSIYAFGNGTGATIEDAKLAAYNNLLQQLFAKTRMNQFHFKGGVSKQVWEQTFPDGTQQAMGTDAILTKTHIAGRWELVNGIYHYTLKLLVENLDKNEKE